MRILGMLPLLFCATLACAQSVVEVSIHDSVFDPAEVRIKPGTTVKWTNHEKRSNHSVLFLGPQGFESDRMFPDESYQRTFDKPGRYPYSCGPHPEMHGVVEVVE